MSSSRYAAANEKLGEVNASQTIMDAPLAFRFGVLFLTGGGIPNPLDTRFQKVSGLSATIKTVDIPEGGQNLYTHKAPAGISYDNLVLERGLVVGSLLNAEINAALSLFRFSPSNVIVTLFNESYAPISAWFFYKAYPVKWSTSELDANKKEILIDTIELAYSRMHIMRI
ncbi:MAG TPA: phage tail protein [Polyangium sp.]|nr:phage tail protein [Polyangium sp.]